MVNKNIDTIGQSVFQKVPLGSQKAILSYYEKYQSALYANQPSDYWFIKVKNYIDWLLKKNFIHSNEIFTLMRHLDVINKGN